MTQTPAPEGQDKNQPQLQTRQDLHDLLLGHFRTLIVDISGGLHMHPLERKFLISGVLLQLAWEQFADCPEPETYLINWAELTAKGENTFFPQPAKGTLQ